LLGWILWSGRQGIVGSSQLLGQFDFAFFELLEFCRHWVPFRHLKIEI
jgi:hypothetical protein